MLEIEEIKRLKHTVALVAHDNMKADLVEWVEWNWEKLNQCDLVCTGTTGKLVEKTLLQRVEEEKIERGDTKIKLLSSGPLGGDQQMGALISQGHIDFLIFFWDPMQPQPHDVDVKALLRIATLYNVPTAFNRSTADFLISSPLFREEGYEPQLKDYTSYIDRIIE